MKNSAIFILFLWTVLSFSQEIELKGIILNTDNIDGVHVLNTRAKQFTVTNEKGQFYIAAKANDTLYFNSLVYKDQGFVVSALMIENRTIYVQLEEYVNELQEVLVGRKLTGDINQDIKQVKIKDSLDFPDVGIPGFQGEPEEKNCASYSSYRYWRCSRCRGLIQACQRLLQKPENWKELGQTRQNNYKSIRSFWS
jgi:hypothetical protein